MCDARKSFCESFSAALRLGTALPLLVFIASAMSASRAAYAGDGPSSPPSMARTDWGLCVATCAVSGLGKSFFGVTTGERAGLSPRVGVAKPLRGSEELEKFRAWLLKGVGTGCELAGANADVGWETGSCGSSAIAGVVLSIPA